MRLALHPVLPEIRQDAIAARTMRRAQLRRYRAHMRQQIPAAPKLRLRHMRLGYEQHHHRRPVQQVIKRDNAVVLIADVSGFAPRHDFAEYASGRVQNAAAAHRVAAQRERNRNAALRAKVPSALAHDLHNLFSGNVDLNGPANIKRRAF